MSQTEPVQDLLTPTEMPDEQDQTQAPLTPLPVRDLNEYARQMHESIDSMKKQMETLSGDELAMLIEQNKVCTSMFKQVFALLVTEQVRRANQTPAELGDVLDTNQLGTVMEE